MTETLHEGTKASNTPNLVFHTLHQIPKANGIQLASHLLGIQHRLQT